MDAINEILSRAVEQLLGRASGPFHLRLVIQPIIASILAVRAGLRDARQGKPAFLWTALTSKEQRQILLRSGWKDLGKILVVALVLDTLYQVIVLRAFHVVQMLIVVVVIAVLPYVLLRGPVTRLARGLHKQPTEPANVSTTDGTEA
jgi:hypothetical protein